jgi:hypothetical protein
LHFINIVVNHMASGFVEILIRAENEVDVIEEVHNPSDCKTDVWVSIEEDNINALVPSGDEDKLVLI